MVENTFIIRLSDGSDIVDELKNLSKEKEISYGIIVGGCGKIKEFELVSGGPHGSIEVMKSADEFQVNSVSGKIQKKSSGDILTSVNVSVTKTGFAQRGGQLIKGKASDSLEILVRKVDVKKIIYA